MLETRTTTPALDQETDTYPEYREAVNSDGDLQLYRINPDGTEEWILDEDAFLAEQGVADRHSKAELAAQAKARSKHAALVDKVNGPVYRKERRQELLDKHNQAEDKYLAAVYEHAYEQVEKATQSGDIDPDDMDAVRLRIQEVVNGHLERTQHDEETSVLQSGGWKGKILGKYANLSRGKKIAVGVGVGVLGAGAGALLGVAGAAGAVVAGGIAGTRFARGYYTRIADMYVKRQESGDQASIVLSGDDPGQWRQQATDTFKTRSAGDIERYEGIRKRAIKGAVGAVALGAGIGAAAGVLGDYVSGRTDKGEFSAHDVTAKSREWARQWWSDGSAATESLPGGFDNIDKDAQTSNSPLENTEVSEVEAELSTTEKLTLALEHQLSQPFTVEAGHGYTHELRQALDGLGVTISPEEAYELHKTLVDQVGNQYISGDVYHMGGDQYQWGIGAPGETTWDPRAVEIISQYALEHGAVVDGIDYVEIVDMPEVDDTATDTTDQQDAIVEVTPEDDATASDVLRDSHTTPVPIETEVDIDDVTDGGDTEVTIDTDDQIEESPEQADAEQQLEPAEVTTDGFDEAVARNESLLAMQGDIHTITNQLDAGNIDAINNNPMLQKTLMYLQYDLQNVYYPDTSEPLMSFDDTLGGRWIFNPVPESSYLPTDQLISYLNAYELRISSHG